MATTGNAAARAEKADDVALKATGLAVEAENKAERRRDRRAAATQTRKQTSHGSRRSRFSILAEATLVICKL